jgi:hypothetical protein
MRISRRALLASSAVATGLAGCSSLGGVGGDNGAGGAGGDSGDSDASDANDANGSGGATPEGALDLSFGEGAVFTDDDGVELAVTLSNPRLLATVPVVRDGDISVDSPESSAFFLFVTVRVANQGSSAIDPPSGLYFEADGREVERTVVRTPGPKYREVGELAPGESAEATIAFPAPDGSGTGTVALRFQTLVESPPARWHFEFADLTRETSDLSREGLGDTITVGVDPYAYSFTPLSATTTSAYSDGDDEEHTASAGSTFVLLEVRSTNVGEEPVKLPTPFEIRLDADGTVVRGSPYERADERYPGRADLSPPGGSLSGVLLFEVPESAAEFTVRLAVGNQTFATWPVDPATPTRSPSG